MKHLRTLVTVVLLLASFSFAQTKEARDKREKAMRAVEQRNPVKAEKLLQESIAASPDWLLPHQDLGSLYSTLRRFRDAATEFGKALELDNQQHKLAKEERNILLDSLGVAQAQSRDYDKAIETYTKSLKEDDTYALFHYNLACTYAEKGDIDKAIPQLKRSWELRDNLPDGVRFPDPRKDSSFREYLNNPKFQDAVRDMVI